MLKIEYLKNEIPRCVLERFSNEKLDVFYRKTILNIFFGQDWYSITIIKNDNIFFHIHVPRPIEDTGYYDIEPWIGYAGPIVISKSKDFNNEALNAYTNLCSHKKIISEIIRFDPIYNNHNNFIACSNIEIITGRKISYVNLDKNKSNLLNSYASSSKRQILGAIRRYDFKILDPNSNNDIEQFLQLYYSSLDRVKADKRWYFDYFTIAALMNTNECSVCALALRDEPSLISAALILTNNIIGHMLLVGNKDPQIYSGSSDYLYHSVAEYLAKKETIWLCLGGGRSNSEKDSLFLFKSKFSSGNVFNIPIGIMLHNSKAVQSLTHKFGSRKKLRFELQPSTEIINRYMPYKFYVIE